MGSKVQKRGFLATVRNERVIDSDWIQGHYLPVFLAYREKDAEMALENESAAGFRDCTSERRTLLCRPLTANPTAA